MNASASPEAPSIAIVCSPAAPASSSTATRTGEFEVLCAELCGTGHGYMRGYVLIDEEAEYEAWLGEQLTFAGLPAGKEVQVANTAEPIGGSDP